MKDEPETLLWQFLLTPLYEIQDAYLCGIKYFFTLSYISLTLKCEFLAKIM